ncbi:MAG: PAS domain S-box protein [Polyangiales bacterium]
MDPVVQAALQDPVLAESILSAVSSLLMVVDAEGRIVRFNNACVRATGWSAEEVMGQIFYEVLTVPETRAVVREQTKRARPAMFPMQWEGAWQRRHGGRVDIAWNITCVCDDRGEIAYIVCSGTDISELRTAEATLRGIIEQTPNVAVQMYDRDACIALWNPASTRLYGWTAGEVVGRSARERFLDDESFRKLRDAIESVAAGRGAVGPMLFPVRHREGHTVQALSTIFAVSGGAAGPRYVCMDVDVTASLKLQDALRVAAGHGGEDLPARLATELAALLGCRYALVAEVEPDGAHARTVAMIVDGREVAGQRYELRGTPCENVLATGVCQYERGTAGLFPEDLQLTDLRVESYIGAPLRGAGAQPLGILVAMHDAPLSVSPERVSLLEVFAARLGGELERRRAEELVRQSNAALEARVTERTAALAASTAELEAFSYSVSHDLRAPVRAVAGFAEALEEDHGDLLPPEGRQLLTRIRKAGARMGGLIDDLLALSRISRQGLAPSRVDLSALAADVGHELLLSAPQRRLRFEVEPDLQVWGDPGLLRVVLENLLGNAWKFTAARAEAHVRVHREVRDGVAWTCVSDNGAGFDPRYTQRLFEAFQRLHTSAEFEGSGIGLATVARIVRRHGGALAARGAVGEGATLSFSLPNARSTP